MSSNDNWREKLTPEEYQVTRQQGTERPFSGALLYEQRSGDYLCKCCSAPLFRSDAKFDAGCGWPSFFQQATDNVLYREDRSHNMVRTEIVCKQCEAHLGHVFDDGPLPTGQRYCVNSLSLSFQPDKK